MQFYYMNKQGQKDGPHDLVTIMRRVKAGKILPDTWVYVGDAHDAMPAHQVEELRSFFNRSVDDVRQELAPHMHFSLMRAIRTGWNFTSEHQIMPMIAGAIMLFSALFGILLQNTFNEFAAIVGAWIVFFIAQSFYLVIAIRFYRGQSAGIDFLENGLSPISPAIIIISMPFAVLVALGTCLFILPGVAALIIFSLVPILVYEHRMKIPDAISTAIKMLKKLDASTVTLLGVLFLFYIAGIALIAPIPLVMPMLAGALCSLYEELAAA